MNKIYRRLDNSFIAFKKGFPNLAHRSLAGFIFERIQSCTTAWNMHATLKNVNSYASFHFLNSWLSTSCSCICARLPTVPFICTACPLLVVCSCSWTHRRAEGVSKSGLWLCSQWNGSTHGGVGPQGMFWGCSPLLTTSWLFQKSPFVSKKEPSGQQRSPNTDAQAHLCRRGFVWHDDLNRLLIFCSNMF